MRPGGPNSPSRAVGAGQGLPGVPPGGPCTPSKGQGAEQGLPGMSPCGTPGRAYGGQVPPAGSVQPSPLPAAQQPPSPNRQARLYGTAVDRGVDTADNPQTGSAEPGSPPAHPSPMCCSPPPQVSLQRACAHDTAALAEPSACVSLLPGMQCSSNTMLHAHQNRSLAGLIVGAHASWLVLLHSASNMYATYMACK